MLNFLRQEIAKKEQERQKAFHAQEAKSTEMDDAILEYAHLFTEMDELSFEGTNAHRERPVIDIPIEDDVELDLVEMDITSGRIVDIPLDVQASQEAFSIEKHYDDFYQEALEVVNHYARESTGQYESRVHAYANEKYQAYRDYVFQEGLFGNDMIDISDARVPSNKLIDFGPLDLDNPSNKHYIAKVNVYFYTKNSQVSLNQLHCITIADNLNVFEKMGGALRAMLMAVGYQKQLYDNRVWDIATPSRLVVPFIEDEWKLIVGFDVDGMKEEFFMSWAIKKSLVHTSKNGKVENKEELMKKLDVEPSGESSFYKKFDGKIDDSVLLCKKDYKKKEEQAIKEAAIPYRFDRNNIYQEAINFGGGTDAGADAGGGAAMPTAAGGADPAAGGGMDSGAPPAIDGGGDSNAGMDLGGTDPGAGVGDDASQPSTAATNPDASTATTNDVSQQIADNVANATAANTQNQDLMSTNPTFDDNVDDTFAGLDNAMGATDDASADMGSLDASADTTGTDDLGMDTDMGAMDTPTDPTSTDAGALEDMDLGNDTTDTSSSNSPMGATDIDNMSMDDMIQQGIEKLKSMPLNQLREFLSDGAGGIGSEEESSTDDLSLEAATTMKGKVKHDIQKVLGDLNDNKMTLDQIVDAFQRDAKVLNTTLVQASKSNEFDQTAKKELERMNMSLNDLRMKFKKNPNTREADAIKDSIRNFTGSTRAVGKYIEPGKQVSESAY